jgi:hypothetical protein
MSLNYDRKKYTLIGGESRDSFFHAELNKCMQDTGVHIRFLPGMCSLALGL